MYPVDDQAGSFVKVTFVCAVVRMSRFAFFIVICLLAMVQGDFPDDPKPCKYGDSQCIIDIIPRILSEKGETGDAYLNLVKIDPFPVGKLAIQKGENSPININLNLSNNHIYGLKTTRVKTVSGFGKDMTQKHEIRLYAPSISMVGPYTIKGKVLILPITGEGISNFTYVNSETTISFTGKPIERDGEIYMKPVNFKAIPIPQRVIYNFTNLFNGDKALGDNMNAFLNENWESIYNEVRQELKEGLGKRFQRIITNVFYKIPYNKLFME